ncbi:hypothetical protein [Methanolobus vulcani]|jgi:transcriptional regulator, ArsR family|uniref:hypothetical protein n=1 Tax=Methanolobus vulcani TaxID=38026 RepID=UPI000A5310A2|nr:hypothetical protein [Methanolobus vulcani]
MSIFESYKETITDIQTLYRSRLIIEIILSLNEETKTLSQLRDITGSTSQALIPKIRKLESLIEAKKEGFFLTSIGKIVAFKIADSFLMMRTINKHKQFWLDHYLETIPVSLLNEIEYL